MTNNIVNKGASVKKAMEEHIMRDVYNKIENAWKQKEQKMSVNLALALLAGQYTSFQYRELAEELLGRRMAEEEARDNEIKLAAQKAQKLEDDDRKEIERRYSSS